MKYFCGFDKKSCALEAMCNVVHLLLSAANILLFFKTEKFKVLHETVAFDTKRVTIYAS